MQVPAASSATVLPLTVQMVGVLLLKLTGNPELAAALTPNAGSPNVLSTSASNMIVWGTWVTSIVTVAVAVG